MNQLTNLSAEISAQHEQDAKDLTRILPASAHAQRLGADQLLQRQLAHFIQLRMVQPDQGKDCLSDAICLER